MSFTAHPARARGRSAIPSAENAVEWLVCPDLPAGVEVGLSRFTGAGGTMECHVTVALCLDVPEPIAVLASAWHAALSAAGIGPETTVMRRLFAKDPLKPTAALRNFRRSVPGAFSVIGQTPLAGGPLALWSQHIVDPESPLQASASGDGFSVTRGALRHCWRTGLCAEEAGDAFSQTMVVLEKHGEWLDSHGMTLADNVVRTWWFVRDIDTDYQGLVPARRGYFAGHGLTENTHYIASTGIGGSPDQAGARVALDSYAIDGLQPAQVEYLAAPGHLGPTHAYGVTFERATAISYADRRHVFLSGTASIDPEGKIVHPGDVVRQLERTMENISALLAAGAARPEDLAMILVYLRNPEDGEKVEPMLRQRFGALPMVLLHAPVCRPGWLVEIEGIAMADADNPFLPEF